MTRPAVMSRAERFARALESLGADVRAVAPRGDGAVVVCDIRPTDVNRAQSRAADFGFVLESATDDGYLFATTARASDRDGGLGLTGGL